MEIKKRILIVEDEPIPQKIHKKYLEKMGYEGQIVKTGGEALACYPSGYQVIISDINLPDISGLEVCKNIREQEQNLKLPRTTLIVLSSYQHKQVEQECQLSGIDVYLIKPVSYEQLKITIQKFI